MEGNLTPCQSLDSVEASTIGVPEVESGVILFFEYNLRTAWPVLRHNDVRRGDDNTNSGNVVSIRNGEVESIERLIGGWAKDGFGGKQVLKDFH